MKPYPQYRAYVERLIAIISPRCANSCADSDSDGNARAEVSYRYAQCHPDSHTNGYSRTYLVQSCFSFESVAAVPTCISWTAGFDPYCRENSQRIPWRNDAGGADI